MGKTRRKYSKEFKLEAIRVYENGERSTAEVERELGITPGLLGKWKREMEQQPNKRDAFRGQGKRTEAEERIRQLERENALLKEDKEILKKVLKMYSKEGK